MSAMAKARTNLPAASRAKTSFTRAQALLPQSAFPMRETVGRSAGSSLGHSFDRVRIFPSVAGVGGGAGPGPAPELNPPTQATDDQTNAPQATADVDPASVDFSTGSQIVHTPACGNQKIVAVVTPTNAKVTWSLAAGTAALDAKTAIDKSGNITLGDAQEGGTIRATASGQNGAAAFNDLHLASHPTGIASTSVAKGPPNPKTDYGAIFDHVFDSNDKKVESLEKVGVGEKFPNVPTPDAASHAITTSPFGNGQFTFISSTLTPGATDNWFLTKAGGLNGKQDEVTLSRSGVDIGQHLVSASNPKPANPLPAKISLQQDLYWYCPAADADKHWTKFTSIQHERKLTDTPEFIISVNKEPQTDAYTGPTGVHKATASSVGIVRSEPKQKANTVQISATALPSGRVLNFSIQSADNLGCSINATSGLLTIGTKAGEIDVRVANKAGGANYDEVKVTITDPPAATSAPKSPTTNPNPPTKSATGSDDDATVPENTSTDSPAPLNP